MFNQYNSDVTEYLSLYDALGVSPSAEMLTLEEIKYLTWFPSTGRFKPIGDINHLDFIESPLAAYPVEGLLTVRSLCYIQDGEFIEGFSSIVTAERGEFKTGQSKSPKNVWGKGNSAAPIIGGSAINKATFTFHKNGELLEDIFEVEPWLRGTDPRVTDKGKQIFGMENPLKTATLKALADGVNYRDIQDCFYNLIIFLSSSKATDVNNELVAKWRSEYAARIAAVIPFNGAIQLMTVFPLINNAGWVKQGQTTKNGEGLPVLNLKLPLWRTYACPVLKQDMQQGLPKNMGGKSKLPSGFGKMARVAAEVKVQSQMDVPIPPPKPLVDEAAQEARALELLAQTEAQLGIQEPMLSVAEIEPTLSVAEQLLQKPKVELEEEEEEEDYSDFFSMTSNGHASDGSDFCM